jgi:hypothetical protein
MTTTQDRIQGLIGDLGVKPPVRVATTAAITLSGEQTIDGVAVVAEDRVLVKDQSDTTTNGIYYCQASTWVRAPDFDGTRDALQGTLVVVAVGTTNAGTLWRLTTASPVIGTSNLTFSLFPISASAFVQTLLDDTTAAAFLSTLGVSAFAQTLLDDADAATARATLGAVGLTGNETVAGNKTLSGNTSMSGSLGVTGALTPTGGIVGVANNGSPTAGQVGEVISSAVAIGSAVSLTSNTQQNVTSITLTAGDWDVYGSVLFTYGATTNLTYVQGSTADSSASLDADERFSYAYPSGIVPGTLIPIAGACPVREVKVANGATATVYLVAQAVFTISTCAAYGKIWARRAR